MRTSVLNCRQSTDKYTPRQKHKAEHERANAHLRHATRAGIGGASSHFGHVDMSFELAKGEVPISELLMMCEVGAHLQSFHVGGLKALRHHL